MKGQGWEKIGPKKNGQRSIGKNIDNGGMLVNVRWRQMKNTTHLLDRTTNWCSHGGWFTLASY